jgi:hypothetical protein
MAEHMRLAPLVLARIPQYIGNLNTFAVNAGLTVEIAAEPYGNAPEIRLWSKWRGTQATFLAIVQPIASYRLPLSRGRLNIPGGAAYYAPRALISGDVIVSGNEVLFEIDFGPMEFTIADVAGVEIVSYADDTLYHGVPEALMNLGIERSRLPLQKKGGRQGRYWSDEEQWSSHRQPDGSIVYRVESPSALRRQRSVMASAEREPEPTVRPSHLRLVIDNTREVTHHA